MYFYIKLKFKVLKLFENQSVIEDLRFSLHSMINSETETLLHAVTNSNFKRCCPILLFAVNGIIYGYLMKKQ